MITRVFTSLFLLLMMFQPALSAKNTTQQTFLEAAEKIDQEAAQLFAESLTDADWYEASPEMLLETFQAALDARNQFPWGDSYDDAMFFQYVLPPRVDDEPLQPYRKYFLDEIGPRLDTLQTLSGAALEVNLWLGERIGFKPTDWRDQGPLTTLSCGYGRCGEMMISAIAAMRSMGIPSRGVFVPFWSANDNNHAWIEVYTEDGWKYMGACEPSTRLNQAWFDKSVLRASVLLTKDRNHSPDTPDAVKMSSGWALNVTRNYVPPARLEIEFPAQWGDEDKAWFSLFNFGTVRPLIELVPNDGLATLEIGHGDFLIMGTHDGELFFQPVSAQIKRTTRVAIDVDATPPGDFTLTYPWPPVENDKGPQGFPKWRLQLASEHRHKLDADREWNSEWLERFIEAKGGIYTELFGVLERAPGNAEGIMNALLDMPEEQHETGIFILKQLSDKDLRDLSSAALVEFLSRSAGDYADYDELRPYVLNPKVAYEYPMTGLPAEYKTEKREYRSLKDVKKDVERFADLVEEDVRQRPLPPITIDNMLADGLPVSKTSAAIWWTDRLRRAEIPARSAPWQDWLEFYWEGEWLPLIPGDADKLGSKDALPDIQAHYQTPATVTVRWKDESGPPTYESEFCFVPLKENGWPDYRNEYPDSLAQDSVNTVITVTPGTYLVTSGRRNGRGDVHVKIDTITLAGDQQLDYVIDLLPPPEAPSASGLDVRLSNLEWKPMVEDVRTLMVVLGDNEPSKRTRGLAEPFNSETLAVQFVDGLDELSQADIETLGLENLEQNDSPFVFFFDETGDLLFSQSGYDLNLPSRLKNAMREN
jgi:Transglutaminase-like superfamily